MKKLALVLALFILSAPAIAAPKQKPAAQASKQLCADDVCLKFSQRASIALAQAKTDVVLLREEEYQNRIPSAVEAVMAKTKSYREEVQPLYKAALASVAGNAEATAAVKEYMKVWTAAMNAFPMSTVKSMGQREAEYQSYAAKLNDAWAQVQIEAGI